VHPRARRADVTEVLQPGVFSHGQPRGFRLSSISMTDSSNGFEYLESRTSRPCGIQDGDTIPRIPQDIVDEILDHLAADSDVRYLRACALISKSWTPSCQRHLFYTALFTWRDAHRWLETFPVPGQSPAHHVRDLRIQIQGPNCVPEAFFEHIPWFTNAERVTLLGQEGKSPPFRKPTLWRLPPSTTSLTIDTGQVALMEIRNIMAHLPSLDDLSLSGVLVPLHKVELLGIGKALGGRFGGKLALRAACYENIDIINMLLEVPTGLRFTEVEIRCLCECFPSAVKLVEACGKTLVKLSHAIVFDCKSKPMNKASTLTRLLDVVGFKTFEQSFDFSKFPNLQEVDFGFTVGWMKRGLFWIPLALSTLGPATSPYLSAIRLNFASSLIFNPDVESLIKDEGSDLLRVADEVSRIKSEFNGVVRLTVVSDPMFRAVLDTLNVRSYLYGADDTV